MSKYLLSLCLSLILFSANAHQADISSTVLAEQENNQWILQIKASLTAFQYLVKKNYGDDSYASPEEFQALVLEYVQKNVSIVLDENIHVILEEGVVKLGHETSVAFKVIGVPDVFNNIVFTNATFKDINRNKSALIILKKGFKQDQFILNNQNQHTARLIVKDKQLIELNPSPLPSKGRTKYLIGLAIAIVLGIVFYISRTKAAVS